MERKRIKAVEGGERGEKVQHVIWVWRFQSCALFLHPDTKRTSKLHIQQADYSTMKLLGQMKHGRELEGKMKTVLGRMS